MEVTFNIYPIFEVLLMLLEAVLNVIENEYGRSIRNWVAEEPVNCLDVINMLDISDTLSMQVIKLFEFAETMNLIIIDWIDLTSICRYILQNSDASWASSFDSEKLSIVLQRAIAAEYYGIPLLPGYSGRGMGHISDLTYIKQSK